jgi:cell division GTPase FtsZ
MGIGRASGENRSGEAARLAIASPLLEINITGAQGVLFNITGGASLGLFEVNEAAQIIKEAADPEANIIFGTVIDERLADDVMITVIATGFDSARRREYPRAPQVAASAFDVGSVLSPRTRERDRDILSVFAQEQQQLGEPTPPVGEPASPPERVERPAEPPRRPTYETEDLDIPAFLRRTR